MTNIQLINELSGHIIQAKHMKLDQLEEKDFKYWSIEVKEL